MSKAARGQIDPVDSEIALVLRPGVFIHDRACFAFVSGLEGVAGGIAELVGSDPARAVALFETILAGCHEKAMDAAAGAHLGSLVELLLETKEIERLADLVGRTTDAEREDESHHLTDLAAKALEQAHPGVAARLWRAQGKRIVNAGKSKYYGAAIRNFGDAKRCNERAGLASEWARTEIEVRAAHHRKTGFMPGLETLARGSGPIDEPSFLDRARACWSGRRADAEP